MSDYKAVQKSNQSERNHNEQNAHSAMTIKIRVFNNIKLKKGWGLFLQAANKAFFNILFRRKVI